MGKKKRHQVGIIIHHLENEYATELLKGAITAAEELDIDLVLLPGRGINAVADDEKYSIYDYQYNVIYNYVSKQNLDGLIVSAGTIGSYISQKEMMRFLRSYGDLPLLTMEVEYPGFPCIHFSSNGMKLAVDHLIESHGCRKIGYVSGPIGNADAMDRLHCYRIAMEEHQIPYDSTKVVYGNFSEASEKVVEQLLDAHPDLEAICFGNDKMCIGGYHVFEERGLKVGEDILVTGFDDSEVATSLKPMLTTIRTNISEMGYQSVYAILEKIQTGHTTGKSLDATLILRESCGKGILCDSLENQFCVTPEEANAEKVVESVFRSFVGDAESLQRMPFALLTRNLLIHLIRDLSQKKPILLDAYLAEIHGMFHQVFSIRISISILEKVLTSAKEVALRFCEDQSENAVNVERIYTEFLRCLLEYSMQQTYTMRSNLVYSNFLISNINKDMMMNSDDEEKSFFSIINNLYRVNFMSSYIYIFEDPVLHYPHEKWIMPENLYLKSYHIGKELHRVDPPEQQLSIYNCVNNAHMPSEKRRTLVMTPLFSNEEQYGLFVCELDPVNFSQIYSVAPQICTAIKMTRLMKELEGDLEEVRHDNTRLRWISDCDELTGAYNRRGFYRHCNDLMESEESEGKNGVLILADLDNLKVINDTFGHNEGDFALRTCTDYMNACDPLLDVVGRIGGDEFAAFVVVDDAEAAMDEIYHCIKEEAKEYNQKSDRPYNINLSLGLCAIPCVSGKKIQGYVKYADETLYVDKKRKNPIVMKTERV